MTFINKKMRTLLSLSAAFFMLTAAGLFADEETTASYIPSDALAVAALRLGKIAGKADFSIIKEMPQLQDLSSNLEQENIPNFVNNPEISGIDINGTIFVAGSVFEEGDYIGDQKYAGFFIPLIDRGKLEKIFSSTEEVPEIQTDGNISYIHQEGDDSAVGWNSEVIVVMVGRTYYTGFDFKEAVLNALKNREGDSDAGVLEDEAFDDMIDEDEWDSAGWANVERLFPVFMAGNAGARLTADGEKLQKYIAPLLEETRSIMRVSFLKGEIEIKSSTYYGSRTVRRAMKKLYRPLLPETVDRIPGGESLFTAGFGIDVEKYNKYVEKFEGLKYIHEKIKEDSEGKVDIDLISQFFTGDIVVNLAPTTNTMGQPFEGFVGIAIKNNDAFKTFLKSMVEEEKIMEHDGYYTFGGPDGVLVVKDDMLCVTMEANRESVMSGDTGGRSHAADLLLDHAVGFILDMKAVAKSMENSYRFAAASPMIKGKMDNFTGYSSDFDRDGAHSVMSLSLVEKGKNSLQVIMDVIQEIKEKKAEEAAKYDEMYNNYDNYYDSTNNYYSEEGAVEEYYGTNEGDLSTDDHFMEEKLKEPVEEGTNESSSTGENEEMTEEEIDAAEAEEAEGETVSSESDEIAEEVEETEE